MDVGVLLRSNEYCIKIQMNVGKETIFLALEQIRE